VFIVGNDVTKLEEIEGKQTYLLEQTTVIHVVLGSCLLLQKFVQYDYGFDFDVV